MRVELSFTLPVAAGEAFNYITDIKNWSAYWPGIVRFEGPGSARWSRPGDRVRLVVRLLWRARTFEMELLEFEQGARVVYVSRQRGLPDARHERHFRDLPAGCEYRVVVEYKPRRGLSGWLDRTLFRIGLERSVRKAVKRIIEVFEQHHRPHSSE